MSVFVGRAEPLAQLTAAYHILVEEPGGSVPGRTGLVLVTGEAGIGKTALLSRFASEVRTAGGTVAWGTCWDGDQTPAWWPWTQALRALLDQRPDLREAAVPALAAVLPELPGEPAAPPRGDTTGRLRVFDAVGQVLGRAAERSPVVVILDDLQWADVSTVDMLRFLAQRQQRGALLIIGAYRPHEPAPGVAAALADLSSTAELLPLQGLSNIEVTDLAQAVTGTALPDEWVRVVHQRSGGHPFYARELCRLLATAGATADVPTAVRDVIGRRLDRLSSQCVALLEVAAVAGATVQADVLTAVIRDDEAHTAAMLVEAVEAGILAPFGRDDGTARFVHDLYRETIYTGLPHRRRRGLHHQVAVALLQRHQRGDPVFEAELAYHLTAGLPVSDPATAVEWTHAAARADTARFAFTEAAGHFGRLRSSVTDAGLRLSDSDVVGVLTVEADLRLRAGDAVSAQELLDTAWARATACGRADLLGAVALGLDGVGARFAMPRADLIGVLAAARHALDGSGSSTEAVVTAALARQLQHSVPADRPQARPLAERAVSIARSLDDPATLASCLLAQHDALWTPGTATARAEIAAEIAELARLAGDRERHAQSLLLRASAQLENGSAAFRTTFVEYAEATRRLHQPRHDYLLRIRQAAVALLDGDITIGDRLSAEAAALGDSIGDSDTGNVRMSQRLEVVRARDDPAELREMAAEAVAWWIGVPAHAHAVAAGFYARAGDLDAAARELGTVLSLDDWHTDRSYLWSVFIGEIAMAAVAVHDRPLCRRILDDLLPLGGTCAVNGALVCFMGAHAQRIALLYAALDQPEPARGWLERALQTHRRLGARLWEAETQQALATIDDPGGPRRWRRRAALNAGIPASPLDATGRNVPVLRRVGDMWQATYLGTTAYLRDSKGLRDIAVLLARPDTDVSAVVLAGGDGGGTRTAGNEPVLDRTALVAYRRRLAELDDEQRTARANADLAQHRRVSDERELLVAELRRVTRPDGRSRAFGNTTTERARKAVTARIRDAIRRVTDAHPELGTHLDRTIRTGTFCQYKSDGDR